MFATIVSSTLIFFSIFSPHGLMSLTLPFPYFDSVADFAYDLIFSVCFVFILPLGEEAFYRVFIGNQWKGPTGQMVASLANTLMNLACFVVCCEGVFGIALLSVGSLACCFALVVVRDQMAPVYCLMAKIGINLGCALWLYYLNATEQKSLDRRQPNLFNVADSMNVLTP